MASITATQKAALVRALERRFGKSAVGYSFTSPSDGWWRITDDESGSWVLGGFSRTTGRLSVSREHDGAALEVAPAEAPVAAPARVIVRDNVCRAEWQASGADPSDAFARVLNDVPRSGMATDTRDAFNAAWLHYRGAMSSATRGDVTVTIDPAPEVPAPLGADQADGDVKMTAADYLDMARGYRADGNEGAAELYESYARDAGATAAAIRRARMVPQPVQPQPAAPPALGSHRTVMAALDAFEAAPWPRPLVEINPPPAVVLDVLPPAPARPFAPFLDLPAPAPRSMADVWQALAVEFGPPLVMHRPALALEPEPRGPLDFLTIGEAVALYLAAACFGLALALSAF